MMLLHTLLAGGWLWGCLWIVHNSRVAMGRGGPIVLLAGWACVAALLMLAANRGSPTGKSRWREVIAQGVVVVFVAGMAFSIVQVGDGPQSVWIAGAIFGAPALLVSWALERWVRPRLRPAGHPERQVSPAAVGAALVPLLLPAVVMIALNWLTLPDVWQSRIHAVGLAGALYAGLVPLVLPVALVTAWAHDRAFHGPYGAWHDTLGALSLLALLVAAFTWSGLPGAMEGDVAAPAPARALVGALAQVRHETVLSCRQWSTFRVQDGAALSSGGHPLASFAGGAAMLALACALLAAVLFWRAGRGRPVSAWMVWALVPLAWCAVPLAVARWGPAGAPWSAAVLAGSALLAVAWPWWRHDAH